MGYQILSLENSFLRLIGYYKEMWKQYTNTHSVSHRNLLKHSNVMFNHSYACMGGLDFNSYTKLVVIVVIIIVYSYSNKC